MTPGLSLSIAKAVTDGTSSIRNSCAPAGAIKPTMIIRAGTSRIARLDMVDWMIRLARQ
jgi:hypothetical protein